jgi:inward rectifier potassium channel
MLAYAVGTGLVFARFSRPTARIIFSEKAIIAPYKGIRAFQFRVANARNSQILDLKCRLVMSRLEFDGSGLKRKFYDLKLERDQVMFFPLNWTIVHPLDEKSPLYKYTAQDLARSDVEFLVLLEGMDDTHSTTVSARSSYKADEIAWGQKFVSVLDEMDDGQIAIDITRIGDFEEAALPE